MHVEQRKLSSVEVIECHTEKKAALTSYLPTEDIAKMPAFGIRSIWWRCCRVATLGMRHIQHALFNTPLEKR